MMKTLLPVLMALIVLPSCHTALSEKEKEGIHGVVIQPVTTIPEARHAVVGSKSPDIGRTVPMMTGGGLIPALIGMAVDEAVTSGQERKFNSQYGADVKVVANQVPANLNRGVKASTMRVFKADAFFRSRMNRQADHWFSTKVVYFGLVRVSRVNDETNLGAVMQCDVALKSRDGDELISKRIHAHSKSSYTPSQLAGNRSLSKKLFREVVEDYEKQLKGFLNKGLDRE